MGICDSLFDVTTAEIHRSEQQARGRRVSAMQESGDAALHNWLSSISQCPPLPLLAHHHCGDGDRPVSI